MVQRMLTAGIIVAGWDKYEGGSVYGLPIGGTLLKLPFAIGGKLRSGGMICICGSKRCSVSDATVYYCQVLGLRTSTGTVTQRGRTTCQRRKLR